MQVLTVDYNAKDAPQLFCESLKETGFAVLEYHPISTDLIRAVTMSGTSFSLQTKNTSIYIKSRHSTVTFRLVRRMQKATISAISKNFITFI